MYPNEELFSEVDMVYLRMTRKKRQHLALSSEVVTENRFRLFGHVLRRPSNRLVQVILKMLPNGIWKRPPGREKKVRTEVVKEDLSILGVDKQLGRLR
ncbi:hypothetical protein RB195_023500 [Necator americanus]